VEGGGAIGWDVALSKHGGLYDTEGMIARLGSSELITDSGSGGSDMPRPFPQGWCIDLWR
jgi:hypothetical protein